MVKTIKNSHGVVRFSLKDSITSLEKELDKESMIMLHFSMAGKRFKKSTGFKSTLKNWNTSKQRVETGKGSPRNAKDVNSFLNRLQEFVEEEFSQMVKQQEGIDLDLLSDKIKAFIGGASIEEVEKSSDLIEYAEKLLEAKKKGLAITTYRSYRRTVDLLKQFRDQSNKELVFDSIDMHFYRDFVEMLEDEEYSLNSIGKHIKNLKTFLNDALINGLTTNLIFKNKNFKSPKEITTQIYLTEEEIEKLAKKDLSKYPLMQQARDIFLIGCYTGQRVSDYNGLTDKNIVKIEGHTFIKIKQKKTGNAVHFPLLESIKQVMNRYENSFPPKMSEPILRSNLKDAAQTAELNKMIQVSYNKGGEQVEKEVPQYKLVKTHTARRSFCTNHYIKGKPLQEIMEYSGHQTEREFLKYIRIEKEQKALAILKSGFFN